MKLVRLAGLGSLALPVAVVAGLGLASPKAAADPQAMATQVAPLRPPASRLPAGALPPEALKNLTPLSPAAKVKLAAAAGVTIAEADLDTPMKLDVRAPWLGNHAYLTLDGSTMTLPEADPPQILLRTKDGSVTVHFRAEPNRSYLVDCSVLTGLYQVDKKVFRGETVLSQSTSSVQASDSHVTAFIPKDALARRVEVRLLQPIFIGQLTTCEITPMK